MTKHNTWTEITRPQYERSGLLYASDLTGEEWKLIAPHLLARKRRETPLAVTAQRPNARYEAPAQYRRFVPVFCY